KRAIGTFFEWDKLDRTVSGAQQALGTKLHQQTRKAISKRQPALMSAIRKFNTYCEQLEDLYDPKWSIPLLDPLPTKLNELHNHPSLMEDVWISPSVGEIPRWMEDQDVQDRICAMLKRDRCLEEQRRLGAEADNLCRWYGTELAAVELVLHTTGNEIFYVALKQCREDVLSLSSRWSNSLASASRFSSQTKEATSLAMQLSGGTPEVSLFWVNPMTIEAPDASPEEASIDLDHISGPLNGGLEMENPVLVDYLAEEPSGPIDEDDSGDDNPSWDSITTEIVWVIPAVRHGFPRLSFEPCDIAMLASPTARINDVCINGCIPLLFSALMVPATHNFAVFSTHNLTHICYNAPDHVLWKATAWTMFWSKNIWIIPIHRPSPVGHWVLCIANFSRKQLLLFDSLGKQKPWWADVHVSTSYH
ncbi:hypothetical protein HYDPIDRAFT_49728, partial [Hydnomerulius pinastri MD-312]